MLHELVVIQQHQISLGKLFFFIWRSCHIFCRSFSNHCWKPAMKWSSSSWTIYVAHSSSIASSAMLVASAMHRVGTMYSIGMIASCPYTNLNGVFPVSLLQVVRYAHITGGIFKSQSSQLALHTFVSAVSKILLKASMVPFSCG